MSISTFIDGIDFIALVNVNDLIEHVDDIEYVKAIVGVNVIIVVMVVTGVGGNRK